MLKFAFFQPDIAANLGAGLRLAACFGLDVEVIEPCGFPLDDKRLKRSAMDYAALPTIRRHGSFSRFSDAMGLERRRTVLLTRHAARFHDDFIFEAGDALLVGRESAGVPDDVFECVLHRVRVPMVKGVRSLNVITALSIVTGEAMRQLQLFQSMKATDP